jgi:hypothetical protein
MHFMIKRCGICLVDGKWTIGKFHFTQVDTMIRPVQQQVYLCAFFILIWKRSPA